MTASANLSWQISSHHYQTSSDREDAFSSVINVHCTHLKKK